MINVNMTGKVVLENRVEEVGIGVVAPFDLVLDREYWRWMPDRAALYITRTCGSRLPVGLELARVVSETVLVEQAVRDLAAAGPKVTVYACAAGSFVDGLAGEARLRKAMEGAGARRAVTTSGALLDALKALGARTVAVGTPYDAELTARLSLFLAEAGYRVTSGAFLGLTRDIFRVSYNSVCELAAAADHPAAGAVFLSCTNLRTFDVLPEIERKLGKPVLSANQVTMWAALRAAGLADNWRIPPAVPSW